MALIPNPRFPHHCRIIRYTDTPPMEDQSNVVENDPMADEFTDTEEPATEDDSVAQGVQETNKSVIYEGICRGFNRDTISDNGDVISSYRNLALPLKQDEWTEETVPREGDRIELQRFGYKEYGLIIDFRPGNLGTHILWKYVRN